MSMVRAVQTLRLHNTNDRFVHVVGDGTPEGTQLLTPEGERIPESVLSIELILKAGTQCARGVFTYWVPNPPHEAAPSRDSFEAWVVFEPPACSRERDQARVQVAEKRLESLDSALAELRKCIDSARVVLGAIQVAPADTVGPTRDLDPFSLPGPTVGELQEIE